MEASISRIVHDAGQKLAESTDNLADEMNKILNHLLGSSFQAAKGSVRDIEGQSTVAIGTIICTSSLSQTTPDSSYFSADNTACVIDINESLDLENLHPSYERIACAKRLKKTPVPKESRVPHTNITLGIIFARDATIPIEVLAKELDSLNRRSPDREWTDMVVVLSQGIINYTVQFPGENISGDFLPPAEGATDLYSPSMYVIVLIRPTERFTFNKMCSFLIAHLMIFSPGASLPNWNKIMEDTIDYGMAVTGYQYDLSGNLKPVPRQHYNDRYIPPRPFLIEDQQGKFLAALQFLPWQDGGVVLLKGKLPLDSLLIFLGKDALKRGGVINLPDSQISYVLPITHEDFMQMLQRIQRQSNMVVKLDPSKIVVQKMADEGSSSPFMARLYIGIFKLRDVIYPDHAMREIFDRPYSLVMETILNTRSTSKHINQLVADHFNRLENGEIGQVSGHSIQIEKPIDKELRKEVESFLNSAVRALKQGMQEVTKNLEYDIGFLFKRQNAFENGITKLGKDDPYLATYLREARQWSERLIGSRNAIEHDGWILPRIKYTEISGVIRADEPEISGQKVSDFVMFITDRLICFIEEVTAHCLKANMPAGFSVKEIPLPQRESEIPLRFQLTLIAGELDIWNITYTRSSFEET